jgi:hypothetical protein
VKIFDALYCIGLLFFTVTGPILRTLEKAETLESVSDSSFPTYCMYDLGQILSHTLLS